MLASRVVPQRKRSGRLDRSCVVEGSRVDCNPLCTTRYDGTHNYARAVDLCSMIRKQRPNAQQGFDSSPHSISLVFDLAVRGCVVLGPLVRSSTSLLSGGKHSITHVRERAIGRGTRVFLVVPVADARPISSSTSLPHVSCAAVPCHSSCQHLSHPFPVWNGWRPRRWWWEWRGIGLPGTSSFLQAL